MSKSFLVAMKEHFGFKEGQTLTQFKAEVDLALAVDGAREYFIEAFKAIGVEITPATTPVKA